MDEEKNFDDQGAAMFDLFTDRHYIEQSVPLKSQREMKFMALKTSNTDPDLTGQILWPGCTLLLNWIDMHSDIFEGKSVIELGAGTAVCSIFIAKYGKASKVVATDGSDLVVELMDENLELHPDIKQCSAKLLKWSTETARELVQETEKFDYVIGSEIAYNENCVEDLVNTIDELLKPDGLFIIGHIDRYAQTTRAMYRKLEKSNFVKSMEYPWDDILDYRMELIVGSVISFERKKAC